MLRCQNLTRSEQRSLTDGVPRCKQSFKLGDSADDLQQQSETIQIEVVEDSLRMG